MKLQVLLLIHKYQSVSRVAEHLGLKQPTITFHMKSLEEELGVKLYETIGRKIGLTDAGKSLHHYAKKIQSLNEEAIHVVKEYAEFGNGNFRIGASYVPGTYLLPRIIGQMTKLYPESNISLIVRTAPVIQDMLLAHEIDIGIISSEFFEQRHINIEPLCEDQLVLICSKQHPFAHNIHITPKQIGQESFIYHHQASTTRYMTQKWEESNQISLKSQMELESLEAIKQAVQQGEGISFVSYMAVEKEIARGDLHALAIPEYTLQRNIYLAYNEDRWQTTWLKTFISTSKELTASL